MYRLSSALSLTAAGAAAAAGINGRFASGYWCCTGGGGGGGASIVTAGGGRSKSGGSTTCAGGGGGGGGCLRRCSDCAPTQSDPKQKSPSSQINPTQQPGMSIAFSNTADIPLCPFGARRPRSELAAEICPVEEFAWPPVELLLLM